MSGLVQTRLTVPVPKPMRTLARDKRGYPVPHIVLWDKTGMPQFTINDHRRVSEVIRKRLCAICGKRFGKDGMWFVGGSRCFVLAAGAFLDPPAHLDCAEYALRVCPFLAARSYSNRIDDAKLADGATPDGMALVRVDFMPPTLPERFGLGQTFDYRVVPGAGPGTIHMVVDEWRYVEFWRAGEPCNAPDNPEELAR